MTFRATSVNVQVGCWWCVNVASRPFVLAVLMLLMVASPFASVATTETQFTNGSTSYTHTFTGTGTEPQVTSPSPSAPM